MSIEVSSVTIEVGEDEAILTSASSPTLTVDAQAITVDVLASTPSLSIETSASTIDLDTSIETPTIEIGMPGPQGPQGVPGPIGPPGISAGSAGRFFDYTYGQPVMTRSVDPMPEGTLHFDTVDQTQASQIYISPLTNSNVDVSARLQALIPGVPLWVQDRDESAMHATYLLTGQVAFDPDMVMWVAPVSYDPTNSGDSLIPGTSILAGTLDTGGPPGPPGPTGPQGPAGTALDVSFIYYQSSAAPVWTIDHPLAFQPNITVVDSLKQEIYPGNIEYLTASTIRLTFSAALGGEAYLS